MSRRVLMCGDAIVSTGFSRSMHNYCYGLQRAGFEPHVLALNYPGDPHRQPFHAYTCFAGGDFLGTGRIKNLAMQLRPEAIVIQNDPWNFEGYLEKLEGISIPIIGVVAVDGKNCSGHLLNGLTRTVFWTQFAEDEARRGGFEGKSAVIPLGVDREIYKQKDRVELRKKILGKVFEQNNLPLDSFVVGTVGRNQYRKRFDLMIQYFAEWVHTYKIKDAVLWMHSAPTGDDAYNIRMLADYFGVHGRVMVPAPDPNFGVAEDVLADVYNLMDVFMTTTVGEGWGLPILEAMSCGTPCIVPRWSALEEWATAAYQVDCTGLHVHPQPTPNTIGGVMDKHEAIIALDVLYNNPTRRVLMRDDGVTLASQPEYRWEAIGDALAAVVEDVLKPAPVIEPEMELEEV